MRLRDLYWAIPQFNSEDVQSGGDTSSAPESTDAKSGDEPTSSQGDPDGSSPNPYDFVPEKFIDKKTGEPNWQNLAKSYTELEKQRVNPDELKQQWENERLASRPDDPSGYALPDDERFDAEALAASPIVALWRQAAHEAGLGQDKFNEVLTQYAEQTIQAEQARMASEMEALGETAQQRIDAVASWAEKHFPENEFAAISQIANSAAGVAAIERMMKAIQETSSLEVLGEGSTGNGKDTESEILKLMDTKAYYQSSHPEHEAVQARVRAYWESQR